MDIKARWVFALGFLVACQPDTGGEATTISTEETGTTCDQLGTESCPCLDGACLSGLICLSDTCVTPPGVTAGDDESTGSTSGDGDAESDTTETSSDTGTDSSTSSSSGDGDGDGDTGPDEPNLWDACTLESHCHPSLFCLIPVGVTQGYCTKGCVNHSECAPAPDSGSADAICDAWTDVNQQVYYACTMDCSMGTCPVGKTCWDFGGGFFRCS